jgi:hypothetical protein
MPYPSRALPISISRVLTSLHVNQKPSCVNRPYNKIRFHLSLTRNEDEHSNFRPFSFFEMLIGRPFILECRFFFLDCQTNFEERWAIWAGNMVLEHLSEQKVILMLNTVWEWHSSSEHQFVIRGSDLWLDGSDWYKFVLFGVLGKLHVPFLSCISGWVFPCQVYMRNYLLWIEILCTW